MTDLTHLEALLGDERREFIFYSGPFECSEHPTICMADPEGGDPWILATIRRIHRPDLLYELCKRASDTAPVPAPELVPTKPEPVARNGQAEIAAQHHWDWIAANSQNKPGGWETLPTRERDRLIMAQAHALAAVKEGPPRSPIAMQDMREVTP